MSWGTRETNKTDSKSASSIRDIFNLFKRKNSNVKSHSTDNLIETIGKLDNKVIIISETKSLKPNRLKQSKPKLAYTNYAYVLDESKKETKNWIDHKCLNYFSKTFMNKNESKFFEHLIEKHLYPLKEQENKEQLIKDLNDLRKAYGYGYTPIPTDKPV